MKSFKYFINEAKKLKFAANPVNINAFHGSGRLFDKFDQGQARLQNDYYGGGVGYFTDNKNVAGTYARNMARSQKTNTPHVYNTSLSMNNVFDVDHQFSGDKLKHILPHPKDHENFARSAGLLTADGPDKYTVLARLASGNMSLSGDQVFKGLSNGMTNTAKARNHLMRKGYDGLRYNGGVNMDSEPHNVYIPYNANSININGVE